MARSRTYVRDSRGRFASTGGGGGGKGVKRGRTELIRARRSVRQARGKLAGFDPADQSNKSALSKRAQRGAVTRAEKRLAAVRKTAVIKGARVSGTIAKPKGLKPGTLKTKQVVRSQARKPDQAEVNITGRFTGQAGKRFRASIDRAVAQVKADQRARWMKPKEQVRAEAAARKAAKEAAAAAKPKRTRTPLSLRTSRAKRIIKEREMKTSGTLRQWENSRRTQERALAFYAQQGKGGSQAAGKPKRSKGGASSKALSGAAAPAPAKPKRSRGGGQAAAKPAAAPAGPKRSGRGKRAKSLDPATEAKRIRDAIASINAGSDARRRAYGESNGLLPNVTGPMAKRAAGLERIAAADRAAKAKAEQDAKKLAKAARATGQGNKDSNRLRTLNRRLAYYRKQGLTPDERAVERTRAARNQLASDMIARGGTSVKVRSKIQAAKAYRARTNALGSSVGGKRQVFSRQRIPQLNIWGRVEMTGAGKFRQIGKRAGTGKVIRSQRTARPLPGTRSFQREMDRLASARAAVLAQSRR